VIVKGTAEVKLDGVVKTYGQGDVIHIPVKSKHQAKNIGDDDLVFIEVQLGEYFGEDDIVRLEDKYGRV
jgi:mannose-6-phosphate isomerase-like protein (cupin superfamily)